MNSTVNLPLEILEQIKEDINFGTTIGYSDCDELLSLVVDERRYDKLLQELLIAIGDNKKGKILEVGCGFGVMLLQGRRKYGLDIIGIEPPKEGFEGRFEIAQKILQQNNVDSAVIKKGVGEAIPFPAETFDVVFSFQVLEHVVDPYKVLEESWRVLKPNGILYINAPNYHTFFEGHYNLPWFPGLPKALAKIYVKMLGFSSDYLEHLNFINQRVLHKWLTEITGIPIESDFGLNNWVGRMNAMEFHSHTNKKLANLFDLGKRLGILKMLIFFGKIFKWQDTLRIAIIKS